MGATCCAVREKDRESDLPAPTIQGNAFEKFELGFPFGRTYVDTFEKRVRIAAERTSQSDGSSVTIETLRETFLTPAWSELREDDSRITRLITSKVFSHKNG